MQRLGKRIEEEWYIPEDQQDLDDGEAPLRFKIRALNGAEQSDVVATFSDEGKSTTKTYKECFRMACGEIDGCVKDNGKPVKHAAGYMMQQNTFDYILEVGAVIFLKSFVSEEEKKT